MYEQISMKLFYVDYYNIFYHCCNIGGLSERILYYNRCIFLFPANKIHLNIYTVKLIALHKIYAQYKGNILYKQNYI